MRAKLIFLASRNSCCGFRSRIPMVSTGDRVDFSPEHQHQLEALLDDAKFQRALQRYIRDNDKHDTAYLAGSEDDGQTIDFDRDFVSAIHGGKIKYRGHAYDPRPFLRCHDAV